MVLPDGTGCSQGTQLPGVVCASHSGDAQPGPFALAPSLRGAEKPLAQAFRH